MSFDRIAPYYSLLERLTAGSLLQRCRTHFIGEISAARRILLLGEGRGRFLAELIRTNPEAQITVIDASRRMVERMRNADGLSAPAAAGRAATPPPRVQFIHANILDEHGCPPGAPFDAVASHFFLDCFTPDQLRYICAKVSAWTVPGVPWLISDFRIPQTGWQRVRARWNHWLMYRFFRLVTRLPAARLTCPDPFLNRAGFHAMQRVHFSHGLLHAELWMKV